MKTMKKTLAFLIVAMMIVAMLPNALATGAGTTYSLTITNTTVGHTYDVYKIFSGTLSVDGSNNKILSDVQWGTGVAYTGSGVPVDKDGDGNNDKDAEGNEILSTSATDIANALSASKLSLDSLIANLTLTTAEKQVSSAAGSTVIDGLTPGYYMVKEVSTSVPNGETYTKYIVQVVGNTDIKVKSGTASSYKKVKDINDTEGSTYTDWQDSADYDINDKVPFKLTAVVGSDYANYTSNLGYQLTFHDKECEGLTFDDTSVKVYIGEDTTPLTPDGNYEVVTNCKDGCTFEVHFSNLKNIAAVQAGTVIRVEYESTLNDKAVIGSTGNPNEMHITFSNNPYATTADDNEKGKTPDDRVIVFTYKLLVNKVDENNADLPGAGFTLSKKNSNGTYDIVKTIGAAEGKTSFEFVGLDDGDYKLEETTTPSGYNTIDPIEFTITATHEITSDDPRLTALTGGDLFSGAIDTGVLTGAVKNQSGATLPSTGGIGTTMFYVIGSILVIGAVVLLVSKKRMNAAE